MGDFFSFFERWKAFFIFQRFGRGNAPSLLGESVYLLTAPFPVSKQTISKPRDALPLILREPPLRS